ncbi:MAG: cellulose binding domain-containing protein, partial [Oscillospiraceae bacterium]|nr:cellulose binding domain-containing protein [Oscillospiraceae bacterium]
MRNFNRRTAKKALSLLLSIIFILGMLTNCGIENNSNGELDAPVTEQPAEITAPDVADLSIPSLNGFEFEYEILSSSDTDFEASVRVINMNRTALDGWQLSFNGNFIITEIRSAKLVSSDGGSNVVINEFWTRTINPHSSAIFTFTAEKPAGAEITLENFILSHNDIP